MQANTVSDLEKFINEVNNLVVVLVLADGCENFTPQIVVDFESRIANQPISLHVYKLCYTEGQLTFPRIFTPSVYYFAPKNQTPLFYRTGNNMMMDPVRDVQIANDMIQKNMSYVEASMDEQTRQQYMKTEEMLQKEDVSKFPPLFQQVRNLGKEMWNTGKNAVRGMPVIVDADTAFSRFNTCQSCEFLKQDSRCEKCGCFMKTKTQLATASCPIGKWGSVT